VNVVAFLVIGLIAGWLAARIMKRRTRRALHYLLLGVIGSLIGGFVFDLVGLKAVGMLGNIVMATAGLIALIYLLNALTNEQPRRRSS